MNVYGYAAFVSFTDSREEAEAGFSRREDAEEWARERAYRNPGRVRDAYTDRYEYDTESNEEFECHPDGRDRVTVDLGDLAR